MSAQTSMLEQAIEQAANVRLELVPEAMLTRAKHVIADAIAVSFAGLRQPEMQGLLAIEQQTGAVTGAPGQYSAQLLGRKDLWALPERAAYLNASAGTFIELDEGMRPTGHPGMHVVIAALAQAQANGNSGSELLQAVIAGYEVTARLFTAFRLIYPMHPHGHFGAVGAALAVALLNRQDPLQPSKIAATSPILSVWDACYEGATARNTWIGSAAALGVRSAELARAGFTGSPSALEIAFSKFVANLVDEDAMRRPLDHAQLGIARNYFKRHSTCALSHAAIDAILQMPELDPQAIERVTVETVSNNMKLARQSQANALSARFSLPYIVAAALLGKEISADAFGFEPEVQALASRVDVSVATDLEAMWPDAAPARVTVYTTGAEQYTMQVNNPHGHYTDPLTVQELRAKFDSLIADQAVANSWWQRLDDLTGVANCRNLFA